MRVKQNLPKLQERVHQNHQRPEIPGFLHLLCNYFHPHSTQVRIILNRSYSTSIRTRADCNKPANKLYQVGSQAVDKLSGQVWRLHVLNILRARTKCKPCFGGCSSVGEGSACLVYSARRLTMNYFLRCNLLSRRESRPCQYPEMININGAEETEETPMRWKRRLLDKGETTMYLIHRL